MLRQSYKISVGKITRSLVLFGIFLMAFVPGIQSAEAEERVITTIKPIYGLVSAIMEGFGEPTLLIKGSDSPHGYQLKPSDAQLIQDASVIFWIGPEFETTLNSSLSELSKKAVIVELSELDGITLLPNVDEHGEENHDDEHHGDEHGHDEEDHGDGEEDHGDEHGHGEEDHHDEHGDEHGHGEEDHHDEHGDEHAQEEDEHGHGEEDHGHEHHHGMWDMHIWLDVDNAKVFSNQIAATLQSVYPNSRDQIESNLEGVLQKLDALEAELEEITKPVSDTPYMVFHEAYQYLERKLNLRQVGAIHVNPETAPSAKRVRSLRKTIVETDAVCIFSEPQFNEAIILTISEGTDIKFGVLDPLGAHVAESSEAYFEILRDIAHALRECLQ